MFDSGGSIVFADNEDRLVFSLAAEETVINDTVKIIASVAGVMTDGHTETNLHTAIRNMLNRFIAAPWQVSDLTRTAHPSGLEALTLTASARVPETENRALDKRRHEASRPDAGLTISAVATDLSFPSSLVEDTERHLRTEIIRKARVECTTLSAAMNRPMRIKQIIYDTGADKRFGQFANQHMSISAASMKTPYGAGFSADATASGEDIIGNAQKLVMTASVTLAIDDEDDSCS